MDPIQRKLQQQRWQLIEESSRRQVTRDGLSLLHAAKAADPSVDPTDAIATAKIGTTITLGNEINYRRIK